MYDIIGDVHGHATLLKKLLLKMGYEKSNGSFSHPTRKAVFVGDFINRGPEIRKTIKIIRSMVNSGHAFAILGNHEINAIIFHLKDKSGFQMVKKPGKQFLSLFKTINEYSATSLTLLEDLKWLRTLPLYLNLGEIRVVHACWSEDAIRVADSLYEDGRISKKIFRNIYKKSGSDIAKSVWLLTKGVNLEMPGDLRIVNNKGVSPRSFRIKWWDAPGSVTFRELSFESKFTFPNYTVPPEIIPATYPYPKEAPIVFFGHYCRGNGPYLIKHNVCCVDSCVTGAGKLLAYRWDGEKELNMSNLVVV